MPTQASKKIEVLDLKSKQISAIPGSENLYSPRCSPDGQYLAGLSADSKKLLLYDFKTQKWTNWIAEPGAIGFPTWSRDGRYVYGGADRNIHECQVLQLGEPGIKPQIHTMIQL